jgi:hypothetical protein
LTKDLVAKRLVRWALWALASFLIMNPGAASFAAGSGGPVPPGLYDLYDEGAYNRFVNYVGGYSLPVDKSLRVDMSIAGVCAVLESPEKRIEIFNQKLGGGVRRSDYLTYSNGFLKNWTDHYLEFQGTQELGGRSIYVTQWSRAKLSRVNSDKNFYVCLDIPLAGSEIVTVLVSATAPIYLNGGYAYLAEGFQEIDKTAQGYIRKAGLPNAAARDWNDETKAFYQRYFGEESQLTWGIFEPRTPFDFSHLQEFEKLADYTFPIIVNYSSFENTQKHGDLENRLNGAYDAGRTLELTLQTVAVDSGRSNMVYDVLNGVYDEFLRNYAQTVADFGHPVLFRLGNEMNGDWCPYSGYNTSRDPQLFIEFYRYVYSFFAQAYAQNVIWVWNPNGKSFPDFTWNHELMYYPGDDYIDVVGMTAYNTGNYYPGETWKSFAELYDGIYYPYLARYGKPLMITEFASATAGGDKNQWVTDMFSQMRQYDKIKVAVWWDGADYDNGQTARSYYIDDPAVLVETFRRYLRGGGFEIEDISWKQEVFV